MEHVLDFLLDTHKISEETAGQMRTRKHSGFGVDNSTHIESWDREGMIRLIEYISRCPFSLARMTDKGEHQIRYYGFYSNKKRGMRQKLKKKKETE